jgi:hypothetical protein
MVCSAAVCFLLDKKQSYSAQILIEYTGAKAEQGLNPDDTEIDISEIYSDPLCEDPLYVENLLGHSWKNDVVYFDDKRIARSKMTVILTGTPDHKEVLGSKYRTDRFAWIESLDEELKDLNDRIKKIG